MTLHQTTMQYLVYLKALGLPAKRMNSYQKVLTNIEQFYGPGIPMDVFDNSLVLDYVIENDPFDSDPLKSERGTVFCLFTHWLMKNHLIPAWQEEMRKYEQDERSSHSYMDDFQANDNLLL